MTVSIKMYSHFQEHLANEKFVGLGSETAIKCSLHTSAYTANQDSDDYWDDCTNEITGTGYTAGGVVLTSTVISTTGRVMTFDAGNALWEDSTITARYAVIYDSTEAVDSAKPLICYVDFGEDKSSENSTFQLTWHSNGIFTVTVAA